MKIKEEPNSLLKIDKITFPVDDILGGSIAKPLPDQSFFLGIIGKPRSGKTTLLMSLLTKKTCYKKCFKTIIYIAPSQIMIQKMKGRYIPEVYL